MRYEHSNFHQSADELELVGTCPECGAAIVTGDSTCRRCGREVDAPATELVDERVVIVPCGGAKATTATTAGEMYVGSYHRACRGAAAALTRERSIFVLSALYGLVPLDAELEPYDLRMGEPGSVSAETVRAQAIELGIADRDVVVLAGGAYAAVAKAALPQAVTPLVPSRGIGDQLHRLKRIAETNVPPALAPEERACGACGRPLPKGSSIAWLSTDGSGRGEVLPYCVTGGCRPSMRAS